MIVTAGKQYQLPSEGSVQGVLAEIVDLGVVKSEWNGVQKEQWKCLLTFEITETKQETGERLIVSRQFTASLDERGNLRKFLEGWRGRSFTPEELQGFDLDSCVGVNAILSLSHNKKGDRTYCNIASAARLLPNMEKIGISDNYVSYAERLARRNAAMAAQSPTSGGESHEVVTEDDIPF